MSSTEKELHRLLTRFLSLCAPAAPPQGGQLLVECLHELDSFCARHSGRLNPQLRHYLERRSYEKAIAFLNNPRMKHKP